MTLSRPPALPTAGVPRRSPGSAPGPGLPVRVLTTGVALWLLISAALAPVSRAGWAQATPDPDGAGVECAVPLETVAPDPVTLPAASPDASPVTASPEAGSTPSAGTPETVSGPVASPVAGEDTAARDARVGADVERAGRALARCLADGDYASAARLASPEYRGILAGAGEPLDPAAFIAILEGLTTTAVEVRSVSAIAVEGDDAATAEATAEVVTVVADQLFRARWSFSLVGPDTGQRRLDEDQPEPNRRWVVTAAEPLAVEAPASAETVEVTLAEYSIATDPESVPGPDLALVITNDGEFAHEVVVLRVDEGASVDALLYQSGPALPEGLSFAGQVPVGAGDEATMVLVGLDPGTYALVDLSPDPTGALNLAQGMRATLTIED